MIRRKLAALVAISVLGAMMVPSQARAATTYDISWGSDFFESGVPGFSARIYPGSVKVVTGDTLRIDSSNGVPVFLPAGVSPTEAAERWQNDVGDEYFILETDPDRGPTAYNFNTNLFVPTHTCGAADDACLWNGADPNEILITPEAEELNVTITATPGTVLYGVTFGGHDSGLRVEVVADAAEASTQAELDARAQQLRADDAAKAAALHQKYSDRKTWHRDANGRKVWDVWVGVENGPVTLMGMYPRRLTIKKGQTVQYHFDYEGMEAHNVVFPFKKGVNIMRNTFVFACDPDGDGTGQDVEPTNFDSFPPECPEGTELEIQLHPKEIATFGNGVFTGGKDFENSGVRSWQSLQDGFFSESPWNVKFRKASSDKGFRYLCTIHGPGLMGGRVIVKG